jgi:hypothetical protein
LKDGLYSSYINNQIMRNKIVLAYVLTLGLLASLATSLYMFYDHYSAYNLLFRSTKVHLWCQVIIGVFLLYCVYHFVRISKLSSKMRKAAQEQREAKSRRFELLIFALMLSLLFHSLFYTVPGVKYATTTWEFGVHLFNSLLELLLLISVISAHAEASASFAKKKQKYAITGAVLGILLFYVYYQVG